MMPFPGADAALQSFLLAFSALFSIVNPPGSALIFAQVTAGRTHGERTWLARRIGVYAAAVMLVSLWVGASVLSFFGISLSALRIAGGLVVAAQAWTLLAAPEQREARKTAQAEPVQGSEDGPEPTSLAEIAFFPLTLPFTTGPGTIAVAIALGAGRPDSGVGRLAYLAGASAASLVIAVLILLAYAFADRLVARLGHARARVLGRLAAFLLLCVGTQITLTGVTDVLGPLIANARQGSVP
ncbi:MULTISPECIES: MarC family protein [Methylobacterium]|uniref:MarC family protein n=1 Tax=Methylobacterium TaxID=407 RepID=UPI0013EDCB6C|nr:MarC family protein [Methylobacterium sp. DB0501]NGM33257.1 NAAT family transporter [Methylobacterium sp. DB0501]